MTQPLTYDRLQKLGLVEIEVIEDLDWNPSDMAGDMFKDDPEGEKAYIKNLNENGVWMVELRMRIHNQMPFATTDTLCGIDSYDYANEGIRKEMEAEAVYQFDKILSQLRHGGI